MSDHKKENKFRLIAAAVVSAIVAPVLYLSWSQDRQKEKGSELRRMSEKLLSRGTDLPDRP